MCQEFTSRIFSSCGLRPSDQCSGLLEAFSAQCQASHGWIRLGQLDCHPRRQTAHRVCPAPHGNRIATAQLSLRRCRRLQPTGGAEMPHGHGNMGYKLSRAGFRKPGQSCEHALVSAHEGRAASQQCLDPGRPAGRAGPALR
jgi:hypothetical protein